MLCVNCYPKDYVDGCRARVNAQVAAYRALIAAGRGHTGAKRSAVDTAVDAFEPLFFNNLVVLLDAFFVHRKRALEMKDGNPLNEVRMLCNSVLQNHSVLAADQTIKFDPAKSVLKLKIGDEIRLTEADFVRLLNAFFAEVEAKFVG